MFAQMTVPPAVVDENVVAARGGVRQIREILTEVLAQYDLQPTKPVHYDARRRDRQPVLAR